MSFTKLYFDAVESSSGGSDKYKNKGTSVTEWSIACQLFVAGPTLSKSSQCDSNYCVEGRTGGGSLSRFTAWKIDESRIFKFCFEGLHVSSEICASRITKNIFFKSRFTVNEMIWSRITKIPLYDPLCSSRFVRNVANLDQSSFDCDQLEKKIVVYTGSYDVYYFIAQLISLGTLKNKKIIFN